MKRLFIAILLIFSSSGAVSATSQQKIPDLVELHAHLFMNHGMGILFDGDFDEPLKAHDWTQKMSSMANPRTMEISGLRIVVATLYAHPLLTWSMRDSVRTQIQQAEAFVQKNPEWVIATDATQAWEAYKNGKRIIIFALEGSSGIIENDQDIEEFVNQKHVRIVTPLHLTDDSVGGVAFLKGVMALASPWAFLRSVVSPTQDEIGVRINSAGLTSGGTKLIQKLIDAHVWIDLAHASDQSQKEIVPMLLKAEQPLLYTHTVLRRYFRAERAISDSQLALLATSKGILGLIPAEDMLEGTATSDPNCKGGIHSLVTQYNEVVKILGENSVFMGSDYNGGLRHLPPAVCKTHTQIDQEGLWNIGQSGELWTAMKNLGAQVPKNFELSAENFLKTWMRVK